MGIASKDQHNSSYKQSDKVADPTGNKVVNICVYAFLLGLLCAVTGLQERKVADSSPS